MYSGELFSEESFIIQVGKVLYSPHGMKREFCFRYDLSEQQNLPTTMQGKGLSSFKISHTLYILLIW